MSTAAGRPPKAGYNPMVTNRCNVSLSSHRVPCQRPSYPLFHLLTFLQHWDSVQGFIGFGTAYFIHYVSALQCELGVWGAIGEIGVAGGKSFATLAFTRKSGENLLACDLFATGLEKDNVADANLPMFQDVLETWKIPEDDVTILKQSSLQLLDQNIVGLAVGRRRSTRRMGGFRLFHVDGGHYAEAALHDINAAACALVPGGVVLVDDLHNMGWPGVQEGFHRYMMAQPRQLVPFLFTGRLFLTTSGYAGAYRQAILRAHPSLRTLELHGSPVVIAPPHKLRVSLEDFEELLAGNRTHAGPFLSPRPGPGPPRQAV